MPEKLEVQLSALRQRADEDFHHPDVARQPGRHELRLDELGLRVAMTRSRYPNRPDGVDMYAVTFSRLDMDRAPLESEVRAVLETIFGEAASEAVERPGGPLIRMFRVSGR